MKLGELRILLENTAGQGSTLGSRFEELKAILDACPELPLGVCIDTAHTFAAGWSIDTEDGLEGALRDIDRTVGLDRVAVVHVNDSKTPLGSRVDRHEHIGKGKIGLEAFGRILNHPLLAKCAFILETPIDKPGDDKRNVAALWRLTGRVVRATGEGMKPRPKKADKLRASKAGIRAENEITGEVKLADYDPQRIEAKWQKVWDEQGAFHADDGDASRPKYYLLEMLPYPSGTLHMGHMRNYTIGDAVARYKRMCGYNVLHPMGWDAFGLPAENAAIKNGTHPRDWTNANIQEFRRVLKRFGFSYDWRREISTCEPEYYRWNQWFFLRMLEKGIAYRKKSKVNWCPDCLTVLANEQVIDGFCWRHETTQVEQKELEQWFLRITQYSDELLDDMTKLASGWPERVLVMQRNWIGKSQGTRVRFDVAGMSGTSLEVFTTRVDTIYGASAIVVAAGHPQLDKLLEGVPGRTTHGIPAQGHAAEEHARRGYRHGRKGRILHRPICRESVFGRASADLGGEFRAGGVRNRRGDVRAGARSARFRIRREVRLAGKDRGPTGAGRAAARRSDERGLHRVRAPRRFGPLHRTYVRAGNRER